MAAKVKEQELQLMPLGRNRMRLTLLGTTPLIVNRLNEKTKRALLMPPKRVRTDADKAARLKHEPLVEYRASVHRQPGADVPTRLTFPCVAFKGAMMTAALELPGTKKAEIARLVWLKGTHVALYGTPLLYMTGVRTADQARTPDIRTRAILPQWAVSVEVHYITPKLNTQNVFVLLSAAGLVAGIGDGRQEKGKFNFGQFELRDPDDSEFLEIVRSGGRAQQDAALTNPDFYDDESEELFTWYNEEVVRRGITTTASDYEPDEADETEDEVEPPAEFQ